MGINIPKERSLTMMRLHQNRIRNNTPLISCDKYSEKDIDRYFNNEMVGEDYIDFAKHLQSCSLCKLKVEQARYIDFMDNSHLQMKAMAIMDYLDKGQSKKKAKEEAARLGMLQVIIRADRSSFDVPATTGKLIEASVSSVRKGKKGEEKSVAPVKIRQEFPQRGLAVLLDLKQTATPWQMHLNIVVYDRNTHDFLPGITITLKQGDEIISSQVSDTDGAVFFNLNTRQDHFLTIVNDLDLFGFILISSNIPGDRKKEEFSNVMSL